MTNDDIYQVLCSINNKLGNSVDTQRSREVESSLKTVNHPGQFVGPNFRRTELWIFNDADKNLYLSTSQKGLDEDEYSVRLYPGATLIINADSQNLLYQGSVFGIWADGAIGPARITEFYLS